MRAIDFLDPLPVRDPAAPLSSVLATLQRGTPVAFADPQGWRMVRPTDAVSLPGNRQLCDVPSARLETLRVSERVDLGTLAARDVWGLTKGPSLVGRVEVARVLRELADAAGEDAAEALRVAARDRLMPKLLHDLANALTVAGTATHGPTPTELDRAVDESLRHASSLVTHMRVLYGGGRSEPERVWALHDLVGAVEPVLRLAATPADLELRVETRAKVRVARWRLESALLNLVLNASEHGASIVLTARDAAAGRVVLEVADDGPGFPASEGPRPASERPALRGHGLASIRRQVLTMGGQMQLGRADLGGALVRLRLPSEP